MKMRLALPLLLLSACASNQEPPGGLDTHQFPAKKLAPQKIDESLKPVGDPALAETKGSSITIRKSSLGKVFLLSMNIQNSAKAATTNVLLPKVVTFEMNGSELALMEQDIHSIYSEIPSGKLLQAFPVEKEDADTVTFKWGYGLASVPVKGPYVSADRPETVENQTSNSEEAYPAIASYLRSTRVKDNRLELRQVFRVRGVDTDIADKKASNTTKEETVQLDIAFSPYVPNPRFKVRQSTKLKGVGFFEVAKVRKDEGAVDILAQHWDLSKEAGPITYKISKTAPAEAVEAMKEGLQYWNEVAKATLGRKIIKIETGVDPNEPLQPRSVIVYWVPYANAGSAYANFQPDPLTGEITSGLVYQTSVFYLSGKNRGRRWVNRGVENKRADRALVPSGFRPATLCEYPEPKFFGLDLQMGEMDEKMGMKMGLDYLRFVVAHETGHTLGLRHNFAGSLGNELANPGEAKEKFKEYLNDDHHQGAVTSSTVMDYITFRDVMLLGAQIGAKKSFAYDKAAISWAYGDEPKTPAELQAPYYCHDGENQAYLGCSTGDTGQHPLVGFAWEFSRNRLLSADVAIESIVDAIRPDNPNDQLSVKQALAKTHPDSLSALLGADGANIMKAGAVGTKVMQVDRAEEGPSWVNQKEYGEKTKAFVAKEFEDAGGLPGLLRVAFDLDNDFHAKQGWLVTAAREKMAKPEFGRGKTTYGKPFEIGGAELAETRAAVEKLAEALENSMLRDLLLNVTGLDAKATSGEAGKGTPAAYANYGDGVKTYEPTVVQDSWQAPLSALASQLALDANGEVEGTVDGNPVKVPAPRFTAEVRLAAMRLFNAKVFGRAPPAWIADGAAALDKSILERVAPVLKVTDGDPEKAEPNGKVSKELLDWAKKELAVLKALRAARK